MKKKDLFKVTEDVGFVIRHKRGTAKYLRGLDGMLFNDEEECFVQCRAYYKAGKLSKDFFIAIAKRYHIDNFRIITEIKEKNDKRSK